MYIFTWGVKANLGLWHARKVLYMMVWSTKPIPMHLRDGVKAIPLNSYSHHENLYSIALKTKFDTARGKGIRLDQNEKPIRFLGAMSKVSSLLGRSQYLMWIGLGLDSLCKVALSTPTPTFRTSESWAATLASFPGRIPYTISWKHWNLLGRHAWFGYLS